MHWILNYDIVYCLIININMRHIQLGWQRVNGSVSYSVLTQVAETIDRQHEAEKTKEHRVEFLEAGEDAQAAPQATE